MNTKPKSMHRARNVELAKIHIAKARLGLDDLIAAGICVCGRERTAYHEMLWTVARVHSAADLDEGGRRRVLEHLRARGFQDRSRGRPRTADGNAAIRKIEALLSDAGRPWSYADAMARRMFHVDRVTFCDRDQLRRLIAALSIDQRRRTDRAAS